MSRIDRGLPRPPRLTVNCFPLVFGLVLGAILPEPTSAAPPTEREIKAAVDRAVGFLRQSLPGLSTGRLSLATLALLKAGVSKDEKDMQAAIEKIASRVASNKFDFTSDFNYDAGVTLMALANADPKKYRTQIDVLAKFLIANQGPEGDWDYPSRGQGDTSISQYAILGLWEASRAGIAVPKGVWDKAARWHITRQQSDGGFAYHPAPGGGLAPGAVGGASTHTMTVAGTASLLVARLHLFGNVGDHSEEEDEPATAARKRSRKKYGLLKRSTGDSDDPEAEEPIEPRTPVVSGPVTTKVSALDRSVAGGRKWLTERFSVDPQTVWSFYYLYGLERLTALAGLTEIAGHDWYTEGAARLLATQGSNGTWNDNCGAAPATSFGVMFLIRATQKMLGSRRADPRFGGGLLVGGRGLPENLADVQIDKGMVKVRKLKGSVDTLLAELENVRSPNVEAAQSALVDNVLTIDPEMLIGQTERLRKLARDSRPDVRRTAFWALGRTNDLRIAPLLIDGLSDPDVSCMVEARNALRYLSKRPNYVELPDEPSDAQRAQAVSQWKKWYLNVRAYDERDDLIESAKP